MMKTGIRRPMRYAAAAMAMLVLGAGGAPVHDLPGGKLAQAQLSSHVPEDDGTYLSRIDPLGGQWRVGRIGQIDLSPFEAYVTFTAGGFLNHGAGCRGGYPAFYRLSGARITITRIEPVQVGKCGDSPSQATSGTRGVRVTPAESERRLASFLDQLAGWSRQGDTLFLNARDGTRATLTRPVEPHPQLAGRWQIDSIGGKPFITERRPPTLTMGTGHIGAHADCNSMGTAFSVPSPGRLLIEDSMVATQIGCAREDHVEDSLMAKAITSATSYRLAGDRLIFSGGPGMVVRRPPPPNRKLPGEYEACGNTMLGAYHDGPITLAISPHRMRDNARCTAKYFANGPDLSLQLDGTPACGDTAPAYVAGQPAAVGGDISLLSVTRPDGFGFNDDGQLILRTNRGLLTMCRKGAPRPFGD